MKSSFSKLETRHANPVPVVAAVIRDGNGRILLARRLPGGPHGGLWEFPGGKVEPGETPEEALAREIREELDAEVVVGRELLRVDHTYPHVRVLLIALEATLTGGEPTPLACQALRWVEGPDLLAYAMPEADLPIARALSEGVLPAPGA